MWSNESSNMKGGISMSNKSTKDRPTIMYDGKECNLNIGSCAETKLAMALQLVDKETQEALTTVSVNLGEEYREGSFVPFGSTFIDVNNNDIDELNDLFEKTGAEPRTVFGSPYTVSSGWVDYPIYDFNKDKLKAFDPKGFDEYEKGYREEFPKAQRRMNIRMFGFDPNGDDDEMENDDPQAGE